MGTTRPFTLVVDSGLVDEPEPRSFASLDAALKAWSQYNEEWRRYSWIHEKHPGGPNIVHMRDGALVAPRCG